MLATLLLGGAWLARHAPGGESWTRRAGARPVADGGASGRPNIVLFVIDTLRADHLNVYGYRRHRTSPSIDALADEGVLFEQAYAAAPWTLPSMASLWTSTFPPEHGALSTRTRVRASLPMLAERLQALGYATVALYANAMVAPQFGFGRGFDFYQPSAVNAAEQVEEALQRNPGEPFFLYVHNLEPHNPELYAPPRMAGFRDVPQRVRNVIHGHYRAYRSATRVDFRAGRPPGTTDTSLEQERHLRALRRYMDDYSELYDAAVRLADERLGSVIQWLRTRGLWDDTLFIFVSDHGEEFFEHDGFTHGQCVYEEVVRVPLIIHFPHGCWAGRRVAEPVSLVDIAPTLMTLLGEDIGAMNLRGRDLLPLVEAAPAPADSSARPRVLSMRWNVMNHYRPAWLLRGDINVVVRAGPFKAI